MKRPAPMDFATPTPTPTSASSSSSSSFSALAVAAAVTVTVAAPVTSSSSVPAPAPAPAPVASESPDLDLGNHSPARQRLCLRPPLDLDLKPGTTTTTTTMATAALASHSNSHSHSRSPTPTLLSIQQALSNSTTNDAPSLPLPPSSAQVDPDDTPRLPSSATLRAANLRAQGLLPLPPSLPSATASLPPTPTTPASAAASTASSPASFGPAAIVPTLPPAWAMPSGATIQQHLALQMQMQQQQQQQPTLYATTSSSCSSSDMDDQPATATATGTAAVDPTALARGMPVNTNEPAFMTTLAQRPHTQHHPHAHPAHASLDDHHDASFSSGSSSEDDDDDDIDGIEDEAADATTTDADVAGVHSALAAAAADHDDTPRALGSGQQPQQRTGPRARTSSTRKRTTSSTSTSASKRLDDLPHGHLDPISGTPVDLPHPDDDDWDHDTIDFMASVPPLSPMYQRRAPLLPPISAGKTHTLVLDLDETLLHCTTVPMADCGLSFSVDFNGVRFDIYGNLRPGVRRFLRKVAKVFEVVIFTASQQVYAERVLQVLDPRAEYIAHVLHRDHCVPILGNYLKDLSVLGRDLRRTLIVDNAPQAFAYHPANGLPIRSWYDDPSDRALRRLGRRLIALAHLDDVRPAVRAMSHVHARLEGVARQSGRVPVGLAMAFSNHDTDAEGLAAAKGAADDCMDVDSWGSSSSSSASSSASPATNASQEMMMVAGTGAFGGFPSPGLKQFSLSADAYPQLWQPAVLPPTVQVKLGLASPMPSSSLSGPSPMPQQAPVNAMMAATVQQADGSLAIVDRSVPMDEDVDLDLHDTLAADAEVVRVTANYSPSPFLAPASLSTTPSSSPFVGHASSTGARASHNATPLAERRGNGSPEPLRLTPVPHAPPSSSTEVTAAAVAPESTLTTPATASNASGSLPANTFTVTPSSPANMNMTLPNTASATSSNNATPLPTPVTPTFASAAADRKQTEACHDDRMDVVSTSGLQQAQGHSVEDTGLLAAMAVSE